jgi:hypothetical protein
MSKYEKIKEWDNSKFVRLTGVSKETFHKMVSLLKESVEDNRKKSGRPSKLSYEDQILMMLEYLREYRTYYHISTDYGINESNCYRMIRRAEDVLIRSEAFSLPTKNRLMSDMELEVVLIDATETPIERPKKSKESTIQEKEKSTH